MLKWHLDRISAERVGVNRGERGRERERERERAGELE